MLNEFGLPPSAYPDWGGGHYGLQPQTVEQLDPSGTLTRLWDRYRGLRQRYRDIEERVGAATAQEAADEALKRWRDAAQT